MTERHIEILARGVVVSSGKLLFCQTNGAGNTYLPGGHVEFGEQARTALEREIDEELGLPSHVGRFMGVVEHRFNQRGVMHCEINLVFDVEVIGLESDRDPESPEDHITFHWFDLKNLHGSSLEPAVLRDRLLHWMKSEGGCWATGGVWPEG